MAYFYKDVRGKPSKVIFKRSINRATTRALGAHGCAPGVYVRVTLHIGLCGLLVPGSTTYEVLVQVGRATRTCGARIGIRVRVLRVLCVWCGTRGFPYEVYGVVQGYSMTQVMSSVVSTSVRGRTYVTYVHLGDGSQDVRDVGCDICANVCDVRGVSQSHRIHGT